MPVSVRCKFRATSETRSAYGPDGARTYKFQAVYDPDLPEDQRFAAATPTGTLEILVDNPGVEFLLGKQYYLDLTLADE